MDNGGTTWSPVAGGTGSAMTFTAHYADSGALFRVIMTNSAGIDTSTTAALTVTITAPNLLSPINGATGVSVTPTLKWSAYPGATSYWVQVDTLSDFSTATSLYPTTDTVNISSSLNNGLTYYWMVLAIINGGASLSAWTPAWSFTTP
jgi:hypothetical protein